MNITEKITNIFPAESDVPVEFRLGAPLHQKHYLVNGEMREWAGATQEVLSPIFYKQPDGSLQQVVVGSYPLATEKEAMEALDAALAAYDNGRGEWSTMSVAERIKCMEKFTSLMIAQKKEVVKLLAWEIGKSYPDCEKEFDRTVEYIYSTIDALKDLDRENSKFVIEQGIIGQIRRAPLGVVLCMGPFNYPLNETFTTLIPALIMGNTVLFKPPKHGTLLHFPLLEAFKDSFPKGVVNTVYGRGSAVVPSLMQSGKINVLTLIGSSRVADRLKKMHPKVNRLRAVLGLDAKNAAIILPDADLELSVKEVLAGSLSFNGQRCTAIKIVFVHKLIADKFIQKLAEAIKGSHFGMPWEKGVSFTPLPEPDKPNYIRECIEDAQKYGAEVMNEHGGETNKTFVYPALVYPINNQMKLYREEQFGPIVPVMAFTDIEEPIDYLIESDHGQQVSIFGSDSFTIAKLIDPLVNQVCRVNINTQCQRSPDAFPFTGRKDSAEGTLSVTDALRSFSIRSLVAAKQTEENKRIINEIVDNRQSKFLSRRFIL